MRVLGARVLRPFLQDTLQLLPLTVTMWGMMLANPIAIFRVLGHVGPAVVAGWCKHYAMLTLYTFLHAVLSPLGGIVRSFRFQRFLEALKYGSASDYKYHPAAPAIPPAVYRQESGTAASKAHGNAGIGGGNGGSSTAGSAFQSATDACDDLRPSEAYL